MESQRPSAFTASNVEGVERVVKGRGNYAFLMESTSIEYVIERNCELTQVGGMLDSKGYGIAMPPSKCPNSLFTRPGHQYSMLLNMDQDPRDCAIFVARLFFHLVFAAYVYRFALFADSPFRTAISGAILKLQEEGKLHILKTRWWKEKRGGGACRVSWKLRCFVDL